MSLNVTLEDLRLGRYETQKKVLLKRFVQKRAIIKDPEDGRFPPRVLRSELLDFMVEACGETGVIVVQADRGLGKSTAAKFFLKNSAGGIMFCNCASTGTSGCYWKGVAEALGIPKAVYESNSDWEELLVKAVSAATSSEDLMETPSWTDSFMDGILSLCSGGVGPVKDEVVPTIDGLDLTPLKKTPTIVFDDFNDVKEEDIIFMKHLYPIVKAMDVLLFVLVRDKATANSLLRLNGWGRIAPLARICRDASSPEEEERKPKWTPINWTREQLEEIVRSRFGNIPANMREIKDGPDESLAELERTAAAMLKELDPAPPSTVANLESNAVSFITDAPDSSSYSRNAPSTATNTTLSSQQVHSLYESDPVVEHLKRQVIKWEMCSFIVVYNWQQVLGIQCSREGVARPLCLLESWTIDPVFPIIKQAVATVVASNDESDPMVKICGYWTTHVGKLTYSCANTGTSDSFETHSTFKSEGASSTSDNVILERSRIGNRHLIVAFDPSDDQEPIMYLGAKDLNYSILKSFCRVPKKHEEHWQGDHLPVSLGRGSVEVHMIPPSISNMI